MNSKTAACVVGVVAAVTAAGAFAQTAQPYFRLDAGRASGNKAGFSDDGKFGPGAIQIASPLNEIGHSGVYGLGAGYQMTSNFRWDVGYARRSGFRLNDTDVATANTAPNPPGFPNRYNSNITSDSILLNGAWTFDTTFGLRPFVGAGIGWARNRMDAINYQFASNTNVPGGFVGSGPGGSKTNLAWQVSAGVDVALSGPFNLEVAYRYADMGKMVADPGSNTILAPGVAPNISNINGIRGKLNSNEFNLGLRYKF